MAVYQLAAPGHVCSISRSRRSNTLSPWGMSSRHSIGSARPNARIAAAIQVDTASKSRFRRGKRRSGPRLRRGWEMTLPGFAGSACCRWTVGRNKRRAVNLSAAAGLRRVPMTRVRSQPRLAVPLAAFGILAATLIYFIANGAL